MELDKRTLEPKEEIAKDKDTKFDKYDSKAKKKGKKGKKGKFRGKETNDVGWHNKNSQMAKDAGALPFNKMAGFPLSLSNAHFQTSNVNKSSTFAYLKTYFLDWFAGVSEDFRSILNNAATNIWTFVRSRNGGATNYQSSDIFINVILGCLDIMATVVYSERWFKLVNGFSKYNRLLPRVFFQAGGLDYDDFVSNIANYRLRFNTILAKASSLVVPKQFPIYDYIMSWYTNIYKDRDSSTGREQLYMINKPFFHIYDATYNPQGGGIRCMTVHDIDPTNANNSILCSGDGVFNDSITKFRTLLDILDAQINAIITDEDCNIIFGDLIKAYGDGGKFWSFAPCAEEAGNMEPIYSEEFLCQIHNGVVLPFIVSNKVDLTNGSQLRTTENYYHTVFQDAQGNLITGFKFSFPDDGVNEKKIYMANLLLDTNDIQPDGDKIMIMTRLHNMFKVTKRSGANLIDFEPLAVGPSVLFEGGVFMGDVTNGVIVAERIYQCMSTLTVAQIMGALRISHFDWAPISYAVNPTQAQPDAVHVWGDVNNVRPISETELNNLHLVDFTSLFDIPFSGKY